MTLNHHNAAISTSSNTTVVVPTTDVLYKRIVNNNNDTTTSHNNNTNNNTTISVETKIELYYGSVKLYRNETTITSTTVRVGGSKSSTTTTTTTTTPLSKSSKSSNDSSVNDTRMIHQTISIGDIIPIEVTNEYEDIIFGTATKCQTSTSSNDNFAISNREPFLNKTWVIGQVLSIYSTFSKSNTTTTNTTTITPQFFIHVKWYIPFKSNKTKSLLSSGVYNKLKVQFRTNYMLLEQQVFNSIIPLSTIVPTIVLPGIINLYSIQPSNFESSTCSTEIFYNNDDDDNNNNTTTTNTTSISLGCYEIPFFCKRHIVQPLEEKLLNCGNANDGTYYSKSCSRGWDYLANQQTVYTDLYSITSPLRINMIQYLQSQIQIKQQIQQSSVSVSLQNRFTLYKSSSSSLSSSSSTSSSENQSSAVSYRSPYDINTRKKLSHQSTLVLSSITKANNNDKMTNKSIVQQKSTKNYGSNKRKVVHAIQENVMTIKNNIEVDITSSNNDDNCFPDDTPIRSNKYKRIRVEPSYSSNDNSIELKPITTTKRQQQQQRKEIKQYENCNSNDSSSIGFDLDCAIPLGDVVYRYNCKKIKCIKADTLLFYTGTTRKVDWNTFIPSTNNTTTTTTVSKKGNQQHQTTSWNVFVGDIVAVACEGATASQPIYSIDTTKQRRVNNNNSKNSIVVKNQQSLSKPIQHDTMFYPFTIGWCPAQVVAIYRKEKNRCATTVTNDDDDDDSEDDDENTVYIQILWLYRPEDLPKEVQRNMTIEQQNDLLFSKKKNYSNSNRKKTMPSNESSNTSMNVLLSGRNVIENDFLLEEVTALSILGRVCLRTNCNPNISVSDCQWLSSYVSERDNIPQIPMICQYGTYQNLSKQTIQCDTTAVASKKVDCKNKLIKLTGSGKNVATSHSLPTSNVSRILQFPAGFPKKVTALYKSYSTFLKTRQKYTIQDTSTTDNQKKRCRRGNTKYTTLETSDDDDDDIESDDGTNSSTDSDDDMDFSYWRCDACEELMKDYYISDDDECEMLHYKTNDDNRIREYFRSVKVVSNPVFWHNGSKFRSNTEWSVAVGDLVCIAKDTSLHNPSSSSEKDDDNQNPWYPFQGPWMYGQVLSIYRDRSTESASESKGLLEVRWFYRKTELPPITAARIPPNECRSVIETIFETDTIEDGIPVSYIIGCTKLFLGYHTKVSNPIIDLDSNQLPHVACRCQHYFFTGTKQFQPIFCQSMESRQWYKSMIQRGIRCSSVMKDDQHLIEIIIETFDLGLMKDSSFQDKTLVSTLLQDLQSSAVEASEMKDNGTILRLPSKDKNGAITFFQSIRAKPNLINFAENVPIDISGDGYGLIWLARVGDVVAIRVLDDNATEVEDVQTFPYNCKWRPAQILAIILDVNSKNQQTTKMQIRWFYTRTQIASMSSADARNGLTLLYETDHIAQQLLDISCLLGPVNLVFDNAGLETWQYNQLFLPLIQFQYDGFYSVTKGTGRKMDPNLILKRAIESCNLYCDSDRTFIVKSLQDEYTNAIEKSAFGQMALLLFPKTNSPTLDNCKRLAPNVPTGNNVSTTIAPFHCDLSSAKEYYTEIDVQPRLSLYKIKSSRTDDNNNSVWTVRLGDMVCVDYLSADKAVHLEAKERYGLKKASYGMKSVQFGTGGQYWPFANLWRVGEIVTIIRNAGDGKSTSSIGTNRSMWTLEVRWFYRKCELSGTYESVPKGSEFFSEEVYETDEYEQVDACTLLSPVVLSNNSVKTFQVRTRHRIPVLDFFCKRFYSVRRKALLPTDGLKGRVNRGRLSSPIISSNVALKGSLERVYIKNNESSKGGQQTWRQAFASVISKLSLTDSSKEAYERRASIVGREKELNQIVCHLRVAIKGEHGGGMKQTLFIAGPPGVGKTACVRAAVSELKHEQTAGLLPDFHFIPLNGMELRHPLEIYIKLCSIIFPSRHKSITVEMAERKLDLFFSGSAASDNEAEQSNSNRMLAQKKRQVFVLLLDEIDYMITKQQTVLYNFFEWPARSYQNLSSPRLIVMGISNTQNLPERLHPRLQSRLASQRVFFNSYSVAETEKILEAKITQVSQGYPVFQKDAIQFAAKKTGGLSGDLRKALVICRTAAEMVFSTANDKSANPENSNGPTVRIKDLLAATNDPVNDAYIASVASVSSHQALVLIAIAALVKTIGRETDGFYIEDIHPKMASIGDPTGNPMYTPVPDESITMDIVNRLSMDDMLKLHTIRGCTLSYDALLAGCTGTGTKISLPVDISTLLEGLRQSAHRELATLHIPRA